MARAGRAKWHDAKCVTPPNKSVYPTTHLPLTRLTGLDRCIRYCLETAHELKPPDNPMSAAAELLAAKPYAAEIGRALKLTKQKGPRTPEKVSPSLPSLSLCPSLSLPPFLSD